MAHMDRKAHLSMQVPSSAKRTDRARALLTAERVALNFLQRMSGIATLTRQYVDAVDGTEAEILDTRKTAPGLRLLDKWAVAAGGGTNHRIGLYDMALIKDNHIIAAGGVIPAIERVREYDGRHRPIEVEVTNLEQLHEALRMDVDQIMLDNMSLDEMRTAVQIARRSYAAGSVRQCCVGYRARYRRNRRRLHFGR